MSFKADIFADELESVFPGLPLKFNVPWRELTTLGVGGHIPLVAEPPDDIALIHIMRFCWKRGVPTFVLGGGSNTVGMDEPYPGLVVRLRQNDFVRIKAGRSHITAGAGVRLYDFCVAAAHRGFGGISALAPIPGTLGGAIRMNAGAHGVTIGEFVVELCGFDADGECWTADGDDIDWGYRSSSIPLGVTITAAVFRLPAANPARESAAITATVKKRRTMEPKHRSAGCVFKNPVKELSAGGLIDNAGGKKLSTGQVEVSSEHANYFVNLGRATEKDFLSLAKQVKLKVFANSGIILQPEVVFANPAAAAELAAVPPKEPVAVLKGGASSEREVSLISGAAVAKALRQAGREVREIDISKDELPPDATETAVVFPVLHGGWGEDGGVQTRLEEKGAAFVGCDAKASRKVFDKLASKKIAMDAGIRTPESALLDEDAAGPPPGFEFPLVVKPVAEGSSVGVSIVKNLAEWSKAVVKAGHRDGGAMVEEYIAGTEVAVGVLDGKALPMVEIRFPGEMYDYDAKYQHTHGETRYLCPPESVSSASQTETAEIAEKYYAAVGARHLLRVDFIIDGNGAPYFIEGNNMPGFTGDSLFPKAAAAAGIPFVELCAKLVSMAAE